MVVAFAWVPMLLLILGAVLGIPQLRGDSRKSADPDLPAGR